LPRWCFSFASISPAFGQERSEDRDNPTPLKSKQLIDQLDGMQDEYFYRFSAGPGELIGEGDLRLELPSVLNYAAQ
jgi:hypothetical protein